MNSIFVSSTFSDMNDERDLIRNKVIPALNKKIFKNHSLFDVVDLRWGIDTTNLTEKAVNNKVVEICFDRIYQCNPFFIIFIGDRYGYTLSEDDYRRSIAVENYRKGLNPSFDVNGRKSITELEIEYEKFLSKYKNGHCLFYIRNLVNKSEAPESFFAQSDEDKEKVRLLKEKAINEYHAKTYDAYYHDGKVEFTNLEELILRDLLKLIHHDLEKNEIKNNLPGLNILEKEAHFCFGREKEIDQIYKFLNDPKADKLLVTGSSGVGKSCVIAKALHDIEHQCLILPFYVKTCAKNDLYQYLKEINNSLFPLYFDLDGGSMLIYKRKANVIYCVKQRANRKIKPLEQEILIFNFLVCALSRFSKQKIILYLDGLDELDSNYIINSLSFIRLLRRIGVNGEDFYYSQDLIDEEYLGDNLKIIISSSDRIKFDANKLNVLNFQVINIDNLTNEEIPLVINRLFTRAYKKDKPLEELLNAVASKCEGKTCLYINNLMHQLLYLGREDFINIAEKEKEDAKYRNAFLVNTILSTSSDCDEITIELLKSVVEKTSLPLDLFAYLAISKEGLTKQDLSLLVNSYNELDFQFIDFILDNFFLIDENLKIKYAHQQIRKAILSKMVTNDHRKKMQKFLKSKIKEHFYSYLENEYYLGADISKIVSSIKTIPSYEVLFAFCNDFRLTDNGSLSLSLVETIIKKIPFISEDAFERIILQEKYQTVSICLEYVRQFYPKTRAIRDILVSVFSAKPQTDDSLKGLAYLHTIFDLHPITLKGSNDGFLKCLSKIKLLFIKFQKMELKDKRAVLKLPDEIIKLKDIDQRDYLYLRFEFTVLLYSVLKGFDNSLDDIGSFQVFLMQNTLSNFETRIVLENFLYLLNNLETFFNHAVNYGSEDILKIVSNAGYKIIQKCDDEELREYGRFYDFFVKEVFEKIGIKKKTFSPSKVSKFIESIKFENVKKTALFNLIHYCELETAKKYKDIFKDDPVKYLSEVFCLKYWKIDCSECIPRIKARLEENSPYLTSSDFSVYKDYFKSVRDTYEDHPMESKLYFDFIETLLKLKIRSIYAGDYFAENKDFRGIYNAYHNALKERPRVKRETLTEIENDPFIRTYVKGEPVQNILSLKERDLTKRYRVARVLQYCAEDEFESSEMALKCYMTAIKEYNNLARQNPNEVMYRLSALSCAKKASELSCRRSTKKAVELFKLYADLVFTKENIRDVELYDDLDDRISRAVSICTFFSKNEDLAFLFGSSHLLRIVDDSRKTIFNEYNYTSGGNSLINSIFETHHATFNLLRVYFDTFDERLVKELQRVLRVHRPKRTDLEKRVNATTIVSTQQKYNVKKFACELAYASLCVIQENPQLISDRDKLVFQTVEYWLENRNKM